MKLSKGILLEVIAFEFHVWFNVTMMLVMMRSALFKGYSLWFALRELHFYFSGAEKHYLSKSVRGRCHLTRSPFFLNIMAYRPSTDFKVPSRMNEYHPILTQYHQAPTSIAIYWPVQSITNWYHLILIPPSTNHYCPILTSRQLHHLVMHSWANWIWFIIVFILNFLRDDQR